MGYAIYSLVYQTHKGWYSWIIGSLVGTVYTFGTPTYSLTYYIHYAHITNRIRADDTTIVHQLQVKECGTSTVEGVHVQGPEYLHRRPVRVYHQNAHSPPPLLFA